MKTFYGNLGFTHFTNLGRAGKLLIQAQLLRADLMYQCFNLQCVLHFLCFMPL